MKVEFTVEEIQTMVDAVIDPLLELKGLGKSDKAALRRWRTDALRGGAPQMQLLAEKVNADLQQSHANSESRQISKPDWV